MLLTPDKEVSRGFIHCRLEVLAQNGHLFSQFSTVKITLAGCQSGIPLQPAVLGPNTSFLEIAAPG